MQRDLGATLAVHPRNQIPDICLNRVRPTRERNLASQGYPIVVPAKPPTGQLTLESTQVSRYLGRGPPVNHYVRDWAAVHCLDVLRQPRSVLSTQLKETACRSCILTGPDRRVQARNLLRTIFHLHVQDIRAGDAEVPLVEINLVAV